MRLNEEEPAALVLDRLLQNRPVAPSDPVKRPDTTYPQRLAAWQAAVNREEERDVREKAAAYQKEDPSLTPDQAYGVAMARREIDPEVLQQALAEAGRMAAEEPVVEEPPILTAQARAKSKAPRKNKGRRSRPPRKVKRRR